MGDKRAGRRRGRNRPRPANDMLRSRSNPKPSSEPPTQAFDFECPLCGQVKGRANISSRTGEWVVSCWSCTQSSYLFDLADAVGVRGGGYTLKEDPPKHLAPYLARAVSRPTAPGDLPSGTEVRAWAEALWDEDRPDPLEYLLVERGLSPKVISRATLGYDGRALTIPIFDVETRKLVNVRRRYWPEPHASGAKYMGIAGRTLETGGVTLYPSLPAGPKLLCEGEFDALCLRSHGIPAMTVTSGMATRFRAEWLRLVKGCHVPVLYDAGERSEEQAISRAAELRRGGAKSWAVRLSLAGLEHGEDATDWFVKYRRTRRQLLDVINEQRPADRRVKVRRTA